MKTYQTLDEVRLIMHKGEGERVKITNSREGAEVFRRLWDTDTLGLYETMIALFLNRNNKTVSWLKVSQGGIAGTVVDTRLLIKAAIDCAASGIMLCHNHPSGSLNPSQSDIDLTKKVREAAKLFDMVLMDHIILTDTEYKSMADDGMI